jgi:outer membrane immunogenic protein
MLNFRSGIMGMTLAGVLSIASANAADVYYSGGLKDTAYAPLWNGPYFGVHGGYASSSIDVKDRDIVGNTFSNDGTGAFGGGTIGWNWQFGHIVYSAEMDLGVMDVSHASADPALSGVSAHIGSGVYGDITGRVGYAVDRTLVYAKGGFGFFNGDATVKDSVAPDMSSKPQSFTGWTLGGGVEYKVSPTWSIKAEYLHFDLGDQQVHFVNSGLRWDNSVTIDTLKAGVNYHIANSYVPLK